MNKIVSVCLSPTLQHTVLFNRFEKDAVNRSTGFRIDASGKGVNASRVLNQLDPGSAVSVVPLGEENAAQFLALAKSDSLPLAWIPVPGSTRHCYTLLERGSPAATELVVGEPSASSTDYRILADRLVSLVRKELSPGKSGSNPASALLIAGSRPGFWPEQLFCELIAEARRVSCPVMADFQGADLRRAIETDPPDIIKINEAEFAATFGLPIPVSEDALCEALCTRSRELGSVLVVTRGMKDTFAARSGELFRTPVTPVAALNVIGCGDSFSAGFIHAWVRERDMMVALESGKRCATLNALSYKPGSIREPSLPDEGISCF